MTQTRSRSPRPEVTSVAVPTRTALRLEALEAREVPAILIQLDYSRDTGYFANNPAARAVLQQAATDLGNSISSDLAAIAPAGGNTWVTTFADPATGGQVSQANPSVGANTLRVYIGARPLAGGETGYATTGGASYAGSADWVTAVRSRGHAGYSPWGGSVAFDSDTSWYAGADAAVPAGQTDLYSVALHELGHVLGVGTSPQWAAGVGGASFTGANAQAVYGGPVPLSGDRGHWADGLTAGGRRAAMDPVLAAGTRVTWSALDAAALRDLGWAVAGSPAAPVPAPAAPVRAAAFVGLEPGTDLHPVAVTGGDDGTASLFVAAGGTLAPTGQRLTPFPGYEGAIRTASGDFNGDGVTDYAFATAAGPQSVVEIVNGRDGSLLVGQTAIFPGFSGGLFVAAADVDRDGAADLVVSADAGAGPHVQTFRVANGGLQAQSSFFAFDSPAYRGGARVAAGDLNRDGFADVVVTTGGQAEGRVATYSGADLRRGVATRLRADFNPFAGFRGGVNAAVGDLNGDGFAELAVAPDLGGPAHVQVWSGAALAASPNTPPDRVASFFAFPPAANGGARLALRDTDGDGRAELVLGSGAPGSGATRLLTFDRLTGGPEGAPESRPLGTPAGGIYVG